MMAWKICALALIRLAVALPPLQQTRLFHRPPAAERLSWAEAVGKLEDLTQTKGSDAEANSARRLSDDSTQTAHQWRFDKADPVQQVNIAPGGPGEAVVTWVSHERGLPSVIEYAAEDGYLNMVAEGSARVYSTWICLTNSETMRTPRVGPPNLGFNFSELTAKLNSSSILPNTSFGYFYMPPGQDPWEVIAQTDHCIPYKNPFAFYSSPYIHTVVLTGLRGRTKYIFKPEIGTRTFEFTTPPDAGEPLTSPFRLGVWADVGISNISFSVMDSMRAWKPELLLTVGDLAYADGWAEIWDVYGSLMEPLHSGVYQLAVVGNHEIMQNNGIDFEHRYPMPFRQSDSESSLMFNYETGPVYVIGVPGCYAPTHRASPQWNFVAERLNGVNRTRTPWVVVMFHTPWYNSNGAHYQEGLKHQWDMEELLYAHGVDFVFNGHVHSYERSFPVFNYTRDDCGTTHVVIGDGGNYEGPAAFGSEPDISWVEPQPAWSAFREAAFGAGMLTVINATHAEWEWQRVACVTYNLGSESSASRSYSFDGTRESLKRTRPTTKWMWDGISGPENGPECATDGDPSQQRYEVSDKVTIVRDVHKCPNKARGRGERKKQMSSKLLALSFRYSGFTIKGRRLALGVFIALGIVPLIGFVSAFFLCFYRRHCHSSGRCRVRPEWAALLGSEVTTTRIEL
mmetsp:Transcript_153554/g.283062  ORF Transcript_153554/g.283062 Transcript_153554/m.283062 type:complete len:682 (-) Transcript_153554:39-2084(-)